MKKKIDKKEMIKIIGINIILAILLFGLVFINKKVFRPTFNTNHFIQILTGSFPNFIAAFLISLCVVNPVLVKKPKYRRQMVYLISVGVMSILVKD